MKILRLLLSLLLAGLFSQPGSVSGDIHAGPAFIFDNVELHQFPPMDHHLLLRWDLINPETGEVVPPSEQHTHVIVTAFFEGGMEGEIILDMEIEGVGSVVFPEILDFGPDMTVLGYGVVLGKCQAIAACGDYMETGPLEPPERNYDWEPTEEECEELLDELIRARDQKAVVAVACREREAALEAARRAMEEAHLAAERERARRQEARSHLNELLNQANALDNKLDRLERELEDCVNDLRDAIQEHWDQRAGPEGAATLHVGDLSDEPPGPWIVFTAGPGITMSYRGIRGASEARHEHWARLTEEDLQARFARTSAYRDIVDKIESLRDEIQDTLQELLDAEEELRSAINALHDGQPRESAYGQAIRDYETARKALDDCLREKERLCQEVERLTRELERCERLRGLARKLREAEEAAEGARRVMDDAEGIIDGIPERYRDDTSEEARDRLREAGEKADEADALREAAGDRVRDAADRGDEAIGEAEDLAEEARDCAEEARQRAEEARQKAREARQRADGLIEEELREQRRKMRDFHRWQERRAAALRYLLEYHFQGDGSEEESQIKDLHEALNRFRKLGDAMSEAIETWLDLTPGNGGLPDLLDELQEAVDAIIEPLGGILDAVNDVVGLYNTLTEVSAHIRVLAGSADTPEERARQFASLMGLISTALDEAAGKAPVLQFVSGYFDFLLQGFLAAQQLQEHLAEQYKRMLARLIPRRAVLIQRLVNGECHGDIVERIMTGRSTRRGVRAVIDGSGFSEQQIREIIEGLVGEALIDAIRGQLREEPPPIPYDSWAEDILPPTPQGTFQPAAEAGPPPGLEPEGNPAGDGIPNFAKYFLAIDPFGAASWPVELLPVPAPEGDPPVAGILFPRLRGATGVEVILEISKDVADPFGWEEVEASLDFYPGETGETEEVLLVPQPPRPLEEIGLRGFLRLRLEWNGAPPGDPGS